MSKSQRISELRALFDPPLKGWGNDDLLYSKDAQDIAEREDESAFKVLFWPEFLAVFERYENPAKAAKKNHRRIGVFAALLTATGAAGLPIVTQFVPQTYWSLAAGLALSFSLIGVVLGIWHFIIHRGGRRWLANRITAERLRHFYFYHLLENFGEAAETIADARRLPTWKSERAKALDRIERVLEDRRENDWEQMFGDRNLEWIWLSPDESMTWEKARNKAIGSLDTLGDKADPLLSRLYSQRLCVQESYAFKARQFSIGGFASWARLSHWTSVFSMIGVPVLIAISSVMLIFGGEVPSGETHPATTYLTWAAVLAAVGLAAKAFDRGLQAQADFRRNVEYHAATKTLRQSYCQDAPTAQSKIELLFDLEREAYWETREFFLTHKHDNFLE